MDKTRCSYADTVGYIDKEDGKEVEVEEEEEENEENEVEEKEKKQEERR